MFSENINGIKVTLPYQEYFEHLTTATVLRPGEVISIRQSFLEGDRLFMEGEVLPPSDSDPNEVRLSNVFPHGTTIFYRNNNHIFTRLAPAIEDCEILQADTILKVGEMINFKITQGLFMKGVIADVGNVANNTPIILKCAPFPRAGTEVVTKILSRYKNTPFQRITPVPTPMLHMAASAALSRRASQDDARAKAPPNQVLEKLLCAVVWGDENLVKDTISVFPQLLLDSTATATDASCKKIKDLTPLQAAICAGDIDMVQMMQEILQNMKQKNSAELSFDPEPEIKKQFMALYPNGIEAVDAAQIDQAQAFKESMLNTMLIAINTASEEQVKFELSSPGQILNQPGNELNKALHQFRTEFDAKSRQEQIFNPYYLLNAFILYDQQIYNFAGNGSEKLNRRDLFWRQIVGYIQRHLPACYLQIFAQGVYDIVENKATLDRKFKFRHQLLGELSSSMLPVYLDFNLGYKYAAGRGGTRIFSDREPTPGVYSPMMQPTALFQSLLLSRTEALKAYLPARQQSHRLGSKVS